MCSGVKWDSGGSAPRFSASVGSHVYVKDRCQTEDEQGRQDAIAPPARVEDADGVENGEQEDTEHDAEGDSIAHDGEKLEALQPLEPTGAQQKGSGQDGREGIARPGEEGSAAQNVAAAPNEGESPWEQQCNGEETYQVPAHRAAASPQ